MGFWGWVALFIGIIITTVIIQQLIISSNKSTMETKLASVDDFNATQKFMGNNGSTGIAIDENRKKVCLVKLQSGEAEVDVCSYRDIISCELFEDGNTISSISRASQIGGALVGGIALGGVGAIIGGLSGKTTSTQKPKRVDLRITINRTDSPIHDINFMDVEASKDGIIYTVAMQQARHWHGVISVIIRRADKEDSANRSMVAPSSSISVTDEIRKLAQLRDEGLISEEELAVRKAKFLA